jgi:hypothetical protein
MQTYKVGGSSHGGNLLVPGTGSLPVLIRGGPLSGRPRFPRESIPLGSELPVPHREFAVESSLRSARCRGDPGGLAPSLGAEQACEMACG